MVVVRGSRREHFAIEDDSQTPIKDIPKVGLPRAQERVDCGSTGDHMHETHRQAAEQHELAAHAHRTAAEHDEKADNEDGIWHAERAMEFSDRAYQLAKEAHTKSGQIGTL